MYLWGRGALQCAMSDNADWRHADPDSDSYNNAGAVVYANQCAGIHAHVHTQSYGQPGLYCHTLSDFHAVGNLLANCSAPASLPATITEAIVKGPFDERAVVPSSVLLHAADMFWRENEGMSASITRDANLLKVGISCHAVAGGSSAGAVSRISPAFPCCWRRISCTNARMSGRMKRSASKATPRFFGIGAGFAGDSRAGSAVGSAAGRWGRAFHVSATPSSETCQVLRCITSLET